MSTNHSLGTGRIVKLVARREVAQRMNTKSYWILTGMLVVIILGVGIGNRLFAEDSPSTIAVGVTGPAVAPLTPFVTAAGQAQEIRTEVRAYGDEDSARSAVDDGLVDVAVLAESNQIVFALDIEPSTSALLQQAWQAYSVQRSLASAGLNETQIGEALGAPQLDEVSLNDEETVSEIALLIGTMSAVLLFISLQAFGNYVLIGVVEEKSNAVVELLLVRARADQLLAGKVIGIGIAALVQFALAVAAGFASLLISGVDVPNEVYQAVPMSLVRFLLGYAFYSTLFAVAGSLVSRQEDAQSASAPIMSALIAAYVLVFALGNNPGSTGAQVFSLLPPIAPLLMPVRMAAGEASWIEVAAALILLLGAIFLAWKFSGRVYEQMLLQRGSRISWRQATALLRRR